MATVDIQANPLVRFVGTKKAETTIITSQVADDQTFVQYQISDIENGTVMLIDSQTAGENILRVNTTELRIVLTNRHNYQVRVRSRRDDNTLGDFSSWVEFKTRDKRYQSPDAITQLSDDSNENPGNVGSVTINVTNSALATVTTTDAGATVINLDRIYNDVILQTGGTGPDQLGNRQQPIRFTRRGAVVLSDDTVVYTDQGATINNS